MSFKRCDKCRICEGSSFSDVLTLGEQALTGVFPTQPDAKITRGPLELVRCTDCGLVQLRHSYSLSEMYGDNYGYRSGLNRSMVEHLASKVRRLEKRVSLKKGDWVLDIGCNDGTLLSSYEHIDIHRIGIDPTAGKFRDYYQEDIALVCDFFSEESYRSVTSEPSKIVTSVAMFYDLESPVKFAQDVCDVLDDQGIWHFEQSYMPTMLRMNAYDTICHEHLEYYSLHDTQNVLEAVGMHILDVEMNAVNGGSFAVTAAKKNARHTQNRELIEWLLDKENKMGLLTDKPYYDFKSRVEIHKKELSSLIQRLRENGKRIVGYGASTKGNVLLQYCGFGRDEIMAIAEVNEYKYGRFTPGTGIPIIPETELETTDVDYLLVLPWHFREGILLKTRKYLEDGVRIIFPLPEIEIV